MNNKGIWRRRNRTIGVDERDTAECSECGYMIDLRYWFLHKPPLYCPGCGARMEEEKDGEKNG